jgi:hypothetical protein
MNTEHIKTVILSLFILAMPVFSQQIDRRLEAEEFVASRELRLQDDLKLLDRFYLLVYLAPAALAAGDAKKAEKYALDLQTVAAEMKKTSRFELSEPGFATHVSNIVLGLVAFDEGNIAGAKEHLQEAAEWNGRTYPVLVSFGPNMLLAKKLIEVGERGTVIQYFDLCAKFWERENGRLEKWKSVVNSGAMPDFGGSVGSILETWRYANMSPIKRP